MVIILIMYSILVAMLWGLTMRRSKMDYPINALSKENFSIDILINKLVVIFDLGMGTNWKD